MDKAGTNLRKWNSNWAELNKGMFTVLHQTEKHKLQLLLLLMQQEMWYHQRIYFQVLDFGMYNPLEGCVDGAYFERPEKGWMVTELFIAG